MKISHSHNVLPLDAVLFLFFFFFSVKWSSMKLYNSLRTNIESCVRMYKRKTRDSKKKFTHSIRKSVIQSKIEKVPWDVRIA